MNTKIKKRIDAISEFFVEMVLPFCLICVILLSFGYALNRHKKTIDEGIACGRLIKVDGYVFEKLTIDGHEYLKFNNSIAHSGSCSCFQKVDVK